MVKYLFVILFGLGSVIVYGQTCTALTSGNISGGGSATWSCGNPATFSGTIVIPAGITITINNNSTWNADVEISGTLNLANQLSLGSAASGDPCPYTIILKSGGVLNQTGPGNNERLFICGNTILSTNPTAPTDQQIPPGGFTGPAGWDEDGRNDTLPIELLYFVVSNEDDFVNITWATSSEENFDRFELQRAGMDNQFVTIATVNGAGYNTQSMHQYSYNDENPLIGFNYYRLKAIDLDGSVEYFGVRFVNFNGDKEIRVYPNPVNNSTVKVQINFEPTAQDRLVLIDQMGVELLTVPVNSITNTIELNQNINPGTYLLRYISATKQYTTRLVIR